MGHPLEADGTLNPLLVKRLERGAFHWGQSPTSTTIVLTGADESMYPGASHGVVTAMKEELVKNFNIPEEVIYIRPEGLTTYEQADDVASWLASPGEGNPKSTASLLKLVTSDFNIVRAKRCFRKCFKMYISEDEVPSDMRGEELLFQLDREHHIVKEYRLAGLL